jgi:hypothetical protein
MRTAGLLCKQAGWRGGTAGAVSNTSNINAQSPTFDTALNEGLRDGSCCRHMLPRRTIMLGVFAGQSTGGPCPAASALWYWYMICGHRRLRSGHTLVAHLAGAVG